MMMMMSMRCGGFLQALCTAGSACFVRHAMSSAQLCLIALSYKGYPDGAALPANHCHHAACQGLAMMVFNTTNLF
jgi:hypothetical protein